MKHTVIKPETCQIVLGDSLDIMRKMPAGSVDLVVTSPPYNIGMQYRSVGDSRPRMEYLDWMEEIAVEIRRILQPDGALFLNLASTSTDPWIADDVSARFRQHLVLQNRIGWIKSISVSGRTHGHFKPINSKRFLNRTHENVLHWSIRGDLEIDRLAYPTKTRATLRVGATQRRTCAAVAIAGISLMKLYATALASIIIRRHIRLNWCGDA